MDESNSNPASSPMAIDGGDHDHALAKSRFLTREEVLRRRLRRVRQLGRCYRAHYWALMEELRSKYRHYCWTYGKSPFKKDHQNKNNNKNNNNNNSEGAAENANDVVVVNGENGDVIVRCRFGGCKSKAMAFSKFCHAHILSDPEQKLYRGCRTVAKNLPIGPSFCNKPVLRSVVPPACSTHYQLGERCLVRAIRRAGVGNTIPTNRKPNLKLHVIASEFVRQIQNKRKVALKETVPIAETV